MCGIYWEPVDSSPSDKVLSTGPDRDWPLNSANNSAIVQSVDSRGFFFPFFLATHLYLSVRFLFLDPVRYFSLKIRSDLDGCFNHIIHPFLKERLTQPGNPPLFSLCFTKTEMEMKQKIALSKSKQRSNPKSKSQYNLAAVRENYDKKWGKLLR